MISASAGSSSKSESLATWIPAAVPGANNGVPLTKWSSRVSTATGSRSVQDTPAAAVTEMKSRPKKTPSTRPLANKAAASGEASALSESGKSRVPASITAWPGRNLRVAGLGVCSVRICMTVMWAGDPVQSRTERRSSGNHPAGDAESNRQADDRDPPFARPHRRGPGVGGHLAGDHRLGKTFAANPIEDDRCDVQRDQADNDGLKPQFVNVAGFIRRVGADERGQRTGENPVFVLRDQP